jgi:prolipoprotein diacylglyceryltransferase
VINHSAVGLTAEDEHFKPALSDTTQGGELSVIRVASHGWADKPGMGDYELLGYQPSQITDSVLRTAAIFIVIIAILAAGQGFIGLIFFCGYLHQHHHPEYDRHHHRYFQHHPHHCHHLWL